MKIQSTSPAVAAALLVAGLLAGACGSVQAQAPAQAAPIKPPTAEQLAQYPRITGFRLSPDGKHLLGIESIGDNRQILVWSTDNLGAKPQVIGANNMRIAGAGFLKNDMLAVRLWQPFDLRFDGTLTKLFIDKLLVTDLAGKTWKEPMASAGIARTDEARLNSALAVPSIKSRLPGDPDHILVESADGGYDRDLFRYNLRTGVATRVMRLSDKDLNVLVDARGVPRAKGRLGSDSKGYYVAIDLRPAGGGEWEEHFRSYVKDRDIVDVVSVNSKTNTLILRSNVGREFTQLVEYDMATRQVKGTLFEHKFFEAVRPRRLSGDDLGEEGNYDAFVYRGPYGDDLHWVNPRLEAVIKGVAQSLGLGEVKQPLVDVASGRRAEVTMTDGAQIEVTDFRDGETPVYLLRVTGLNYPTEHYMLRGQRLSLLGREYPQIDRRALGKSRLVYYTARDGLNVPAILTEPNPELCGKGPHSAVIHPHGGPWARDSMDYDGSGWVPLMVSRCRVVLQPQFRGSADWGRTLWMAGDAQWGERMQDDKDDGARWLVEQKLADPKRIAMFGFSYGGYAAFAAAVRPNDLYKCAIAGAGVSDIQRIGSRFYSNPFYREGQEPTIKGLNPLSQADKIKIPIMVYHGERDQIVPLEQSELFVDKARKAGRPVEYHMLPDYSHGPAWTRAIMARQLGLIDDYLAKGCGGGGL